MKKDNLCESCKHARIIKTKRGSEFILCEFFKKYPRLPVTECNEHMAQ